MDFGASLLYDVEDIDLNDNLLYKYNKSSTLFKTHDEQIKFIKNYLNNKNILNINKDEFFDWLEYENNDIFNLMSEKREYYIKELIKLNFDRYIIDFIE